MKTVSVTVEQRHVDAGTHHVCGCPLALAMREVGYPSAEITSLRWYIDDWHHGVNLPPDAAAFVEAFDDDKPLCVPATFILPLEVA